MGLKEWGNLVRKIESEMQFDAYGGDKTIPIEFFEKYMPKKAKDEMADLEMRRNMQVKNEEDLQHQLTVAREQINQGLRAAPREPVKTNEEKIQATLDKGKSYLSIHPEGVVFNEGTIESPKLKGFPNKNVAKMYRLKNPKAIEMSMSDFGGEPTFAEGMAPQQPTVGQPVPVTYNGKTYMLPPDKAAEFKQKYGGQ
jgi:hypothetical protein